MKFLDTIGLTYFWEKIKDWANSRFFSKEGGEISPKSGLHYIINGEQLNVSESGSENETINIFTVDKNGMEAIAIMKSGGTATQVLMADGSVKTLNANNGIAGLDSKGNVPLAQLGNLDTTVAEVVTALPTTNIKKHIYLIKDTNGVTQDKYEEYIYTGDTSATYDASKWEKLGDFRATVDLAFYAKKSETVNRLEVGTENTGTNTKRQYIGVYNADYKDSKAAEIEMLEATTNMSGFMSYSDKIKLNSIDHNANNYSLPLATASLRGGIQVGYAANGKNYPVQLSGDKAYVNVPWTDTNTTYDLATSTKDGLMKSTDKSKLDGIANNANNYSLPTASSTIKGGITLGYSQNGKNYPVALDSNGKAYVNVPWIDTNTTYDLSPYAKKSEAVGGIDVDESPNAVDFECKDINNNTLGYFSLEKASENVAGVMSSEDRKKLNGIASGATADSAITTAEIDALFS